MVVFNELDGLPIEMGVGVTYRVNESNANVLAFMERLEQWAQE